MTAATFAPRTTRQRLLAGAAEVFAQKGLSAATTREIALAAGVNEVTLFRHFQSKQKLLTAVIEDIFTEPAEQAVPPPTGELRALLRHFATAYSRRLHRNVALMRVLVGEIQHCDEQEVRVVREVFRPQRQELVALLRAGQAAGSIRPGAPAAILADQFGAMIFTGVLRGSLPGSREYSAASYLEECVETLARALAPDPLPRHP